MRFKAILKLVLPAFVRGAIRNWLMAELYQHPPETSAIQLEELSPETFILKQRLVHESPSAQTALDIFKGLWISKLPGEFAKFQAGSIPLFEDQRIPMGAPWFGGIEGKTVLDLGPLEGGQSFVLEQMGAAAVTAVEANALLYLRCLVSKEVLGMQRTRFLCGNVVEYLKNTEDQYDLCVGCGILYHMVDPIELLSLIAKNCRHVLVWSHYYDPVETKRNRVGFYAESKREFLGRTYTYHRQEYREGFVGKTYCGGIVPHSNWMSREDLLSALKAVGYQEIHQLSDDDTVSGPAILLAASKL